ncbi:DMSO reductase anchor subunit [Desulfitobacterium dichloroeliminans LMG P-21439]|uniref:DMSO reductase anchor subunit n=1 Tax=Desulfitobacterium dichloroeliminans (strain LMG P-21439 / DCA1) TaxID=871963 RepID=L0F5X6_DESDL|nr:DmsC/YnfH family molybdoenzyme membrane anchor subunit [Desulfitobacterium dichloroeliminans]AGA68031.1 DMSO reductase anchor subunit [Desulfitobacterium dichloroeliminans LMG P-21439]
MGQWEWPLVIFTVLGQTSVGIIFCLWLLERKQSKLATTATTEYQSFIKRSVLVSGVLLAVAMIASLFHLGHPLEAYRALTHLGTSWLSREILLFIFTFGAWAYLALLSRRPGSKMTGIMALTSGLGFLGIISSALIYTLPRVPAWNNLGPVIFFLMTSVILGTLFTVFLGRKVLSSGEIKQLLNIALGSVIGSAILSLLYFSLLQVTPEGAATAQYLLASPVFWLRATVGWVIPIFLIMNAVRKKETPQPQMILFALTCGVAGELLGRGLFYVSAVGMHITALM